MQNTHSRWSSFFRLLLLIPTVGLAYADVVITAGTASTYVTCCGPGSSSSGSFALQGAGLTLNTSGTSYDLLNVSGSAQTVAFDPASTQVN